MPFKRNPIRAEKINSLARYLAGLPRLAWDNAAHSLLERTLDDSANRRILLPESFLAADELLRTANSILSKLRVDETAIARNMSIYGPFAATERVLMALVKSGADRQEMHERIRMNAMQAWEAVRRGEENPLVSMMCQDAELTEYLPEQEIRSLMDARSHVGDAPRRARRLAKDLLALKHKGRQFLSALTLVSSPTGSYFSVSIPHRSKHLIVRGKLEILQAKLLSLGAFSNCQLCQVGFIHHAFVGLHQTLLELFHHIVQVTHRPLGLEELQDGLGGPLAIPACHANQSGAGLARPACQEDALDGLIGIRVEGLV